MIWRYDEPQARRMRMALVADNVYCMVSEALRKQHPGNTPLNSVEIWMAAHSLTCDLIQSPAPEEIFDDLIADLDEQVSRFKSRDSGFKDEGFSLFLILMVSMCQISALRKQIPDADALLKREMDICRRHEMYFPLLEQFDEKEIRLQLAGRKIDLLTYEMIKVGGDKDEKRQMLDAFVQAASKFSPQSLESNLLVLNYINLKNGHVYDDLILDMYGQLEKKTERQKTTEMIFGNKNVSQAGGIQMNGNMPQDLAGFLDSLGNLKLLGDGRG